MCECRSPQGEREEEYASRQEEEYASRHLKSIGVGAKRSSMKIRAGYEISYDCPQPTPMILALSVHPSRVPDLLTPDRMRLDPPLPATQYRHGVGNICHVIRPPTGRLTIS